MSTFEISPRGPFSLAAAAAFGFGQRDASSGATMRLAFVLDDLEQHAAVSLREDDHGTIHGNVTGTVDVDAARRQVARILSLDADGEAWMEVGERDRVIGELQARHPGQRPVLFHSPYEAAAWAVLSARIRHPQAQAARAALSRALGAAMVVDGEEMLAFPTPARLLELDPGAPSAGLTGEKVARLHGVAEAALRGELEPGTLATLPQEEAEARVQQIRGIGPFYATLVVVRATGTTDALATAENRAMSHAARLYGRAALTAEDFRALAEPWRPFRTWATVLMRVHGEREGWR